MDSTRRWAQKFHIWGLGGISDRSLAHCFVTRWAFCALDHVSHMNRATPKQTSTKDSHLGVGDWSSNVSGMKASLTKDLWPNKEVAGGSLPRNPRKPKRDIGSCETMVHNLMTTLVVGNLEKSPLHSAHRNRAKKQYVACHANSNAHDCSRFAGGFGFPFEVAFCL